MFDYSSIPAEYKMSITIPEASSFLENGKKAESRYAINSVSSDAYGLNRISKVYKATVLNLVMTNGFDFDISANYTSSTGGIQGALGAVNKWLADLGAGAISQRSAVLNYTGSTISEIRLPFLLINDKLESNFLKDELDHLYRAVLPTIGNEQDKLMQGGPLGVAANLLNQAGVLDMDSDAINKAIKDKEQQGGVFVSTIAKGVGLAESLGESVGREYLGIYGFQAPLSYNPIDLTDIKGTVTLRIGKYFECSDLVISKIDVKLSKEVSNGAPLYATGTITFRFVKMIDHRAFREYFIGQANVPDTRDGWTALPSSKVQSDFISLLSKLWGLATDTVAGTNDSPRTNNNNTGQGGQGGK